LQQVRQLSPRIQAYKHERRARTIMFVAIGAGVALLVYYLWVR
jgi:hypothetical protein